MATAVNRPPLAPEGPNGANPHVRVNTDMTNSAQQDPGLHSTNHDPGSSSHPQHPVFARPLFYVPAPPLPPFLQYQWPMPMPYNPFPGFLGMGYGMVMPPLPPPPYLDSPAYIVPHPQVQPVDYRRLLHPQAHSHAPGGPLQNLNQTRRNRLPHTMPVRETVNSEVQTEPIHRGGGGYEEGCPILSSDSGRATASNSPSSLSSSSQKQGSAEVEAYMLATADAKEQVNGAGTNEVKHVCNMVHPTEMIVQSSGRETQDMQGHKDGAVQEPSLIPHCRNAHCNMWSVSSQDGMGPVCSSSRTEDEVKERRISVPDILSWGGGTSQKAMTMAAEALPQNNHEVPCYENEVEPEKSVYQSPSKPRDYPVVVGSADNFDTKVISSSKDSEMIFKILRLPSLLDPFSLSRDADSVEPVVKPCLSNRDEILQPLNAVCSGTENVSETHEEPTEITPNRTSLSRCQMNKNINESVWSVESLAPFIPTKEWLQQNSVFEPEVTVEMERAENGKWSTKKDDPIGKYGKKRRQSSRFSSSDSVLVSERLLTFSTPAKKQSSPKNPDMCETEVSETKGTEESQSTVPSEKHPLISLNTLQGIILTASTDEDMNENGSSDPESNQSPNQGTLINEKEEKSSFERKETCLINSAAEDKALSTSQTALQNDIQMEAATGPHNADGQMKNVELGVPTTDQKMAPVTPSKGNLVDCAIQCTDLQGLKCLCEELKGSVGANRKPHKHPDSKKANDGKAEAFCMQKNSKRNGQWRNRGPEKHTSQQEDCNGYGSRPGKMKGGSGRNPRY